MLIITPQQLAEGWMELRNGCTKTPITIRHDYKVIYQRKDGNYLVEDPEDTVKGLTMQANGT